MRHWPVDGLPPVGALNRAVATAQMRGAAAALAETERLDCTATTSATPPEADLLTRLDRVTEAAKADRVAGEHAANPTERASPLTQADRPQGGPGARR